MFVEVAMDLLQPLILQWIIDKGIADNDTPYVIKMGLIMVAVALIGLIGGVGCSVFSTKAAVSFSTDLRKEVFRKIEHFSSKTADSFGTGKLITIATNDVNAVHSAILMSLKVLVRGPLLFIGSIILVFVSAREFFPILAAVIPLLAAVNWIIMKKAGALFLKVQEAMDKMNTRLQENLAGIRVVKAFGRQKHEMKKFSKVNGELTNVNIDANKVLTKLMPLMLLFVNLGIVAALVSGAFKIKGGTTEIGVILAFINYLTITLNALMSSSHALMTLTRAFPSAERIWNVLTIKEEISGNVHKEKIPIAGDVEFRNVSFRYSGTGEYVIKNISFLAKKGEKVGIIGSIGSGKTTIAKLMARLYDPQEGEILIDGINLKDYHLSHLREAMAVVPQKTILFSGTVKENILFGKEDGNEAELNFAAEKSMALPFIEKFDGRFDHTVTQGGTNLSGGQKQRLAIARAFIRKPAIMIFDDCTSAVDALSERAILKSIYGDFSEATVFIISSKISAIKDADKIIVLDGGKISGIGTHQQLLRDNAVYKEIYLTQSGREEFADERAKRPLPQ